MITQLATIAPTGLQRAEDWSQERVEFIRRAFCGGAPDAIASTFIEISKRRGLAPEERHIYLVERGRDNWVIQTGIDGYRSMAARSRAYAGSDDVIYDSEDATHPKKATITVWRMIKSQRCPFTASARWSEYNAGQARWKDMPYLMLGKCAEALALRKAFPAELAGVYTDAEMDQAEAPLAPQPMTRPIQEMPKPMGVDVVFSSDVAAGRVRPDSDGRPELIDAETGEIIPDLLPFDAMTEKQFGMLRGLAKRVWTDPDTAKALLLKLADKRFKGVLDFQSMTKQQASALIDELNVQDDETQTADEKLVALRVKLANELEPDALSDVPE